MHRAPEVRIIGDGKAGPSKAASARDGNAGRPVEDDVLRIEAEDPVFYIGPDTSPPGPGAKCDRRAASANWDALRRPRDDRSPASTPPRNQAHPDGRHSGRNGTARQASAARPRPETAVRRVAAPPPEPPPLASGRVRTAELAGSMLWAAPLLALLTVPAAAILGIDVTSDPQQLAFLYGMALLGTWTTLVPNKLIEFRKLDWINRRLIALAAGLVVGGGSLVLARTVAARPEPTGSVF